MSEIIAQLTLASAELPLWGRYTVVLIGSSVIVTGWRAYRFWFSLMVTLLAGIWGLIYGPRYHVAPVLAGVLSAVGMGCVALAVTRLLVFVAGGWLCWQAALLVVPAWANPLVCLLVGGILSTLLFRLVVRLVTASLGIVLMALGMGWIGGGGELVAVSNWVSKLGLANPDWAWLLASVSGALLQTLCDRVLDKWQARRQEAKKKAAEKKEPVAQAA
uniref:DUF4203 domain-containing protein n=1 Tax=uncultured Planctomycetota bacterium TaxID=120965 RepID=H5SFQ5_9BACT|nr:hypothetical protein HGMM_F22C11C06 [uncultured Planctomycetota bacterium]